jgi:hypothetical protein
VGKKNERGTIFEKDTMMDSQHGAYEKKLKLNMVPMARTISVQSEDPSEIEAAKNELVNTDGDTVVQVSPLRLAARRFNKAVRKIAGTATRTLRGESSPDTPLQPNSSLSVGKKRKGRTHQAVALELTIESARHFPKMDVLGSCDAYCQVQWMNKDFRTAIIKNSMNPDWHDVCGNRAPSFQGRAVSQSHVSQYVPDKYI